MFTRKKYSNMSLFAKDVIFFTLFSTSIILMNVHQSESTNVSTLPTSLKETVRPLPLRNHTWRTIRESNLLYIDKTPFLMKLLDNCHCYRFLRRPPGFGKTTFIEMVADFFRGNKDMFKGLAIDEVGNTKYEHYTWSMPKTGEPLPKWIEFAVIHLNFREISNFNTEEEFHSQYQFLLKSIAKTYSVNTTSYGVEGSDKYFDLNRLIRKLHRKFNSTRVIVLVDEYDYPFQYADTVLNNTKLATEIKFHLDHMYSVIKSSRDEVGFALFSGVLKLNTMIFGSTGMNVFSDLSFDKDLAGAFGFTENEIKNNLGLHLEEWVRQESTTVNARSASDDPTSPGEKLLEELRSWYGGYQFSEECDASEVSNPVSTLESLRQRKFSNYHLPAYSLHFIVEQFYKEAQTWDSLNNVNLTYYYPITDETPELHNQNPQKWWMLSNGYYTISNYKCEVIDYMCWNSITLKFPNKEMEELMEYHLAMYLPDENKFIHEDYSNELEEFSNAMANKDIEKAMRILSIFKFQSYINGYNESKYINPEEMTRRLGFFLRTARINYQEGVNFNTDTNSTADGGNLDTLQTTNLKVNYIIKIRTTNNTNETVFPIIEHLLQYSKDHPNSFTHATGNQTNFCLLGLNYAFHEGSAQLNSWIVLPFANGDPQYSDVVAQPRDLKQILLEKFSP